MENPGMFKLSIHYSDGEIFAACTEAVRIKNEGGTWMLDAWDIRGKQCIRMALAEGTERVICDDRIIWRRNMDGTEPMELKHAFPYLGALK